MGYLSAKGFSIKDPVSLWKCDLVLVVQKDASRKSNTADCHDRFEIKIWESKIPQKREEAGREIIMQTDLFKDVQSFC